MRLEQRALAVDVQRHQRESLFTDQRRIIEMTGDYTRLLGLDPAQVFSDVKNPDFWDPKYLDERGRNWGMHTMDTLRCLIDFERTNALLAGIKKTVEDMRWEGRQNIVGIDAGTGSGILAMGLVAAGCSKVYALEINPETVKTSRQFIKKHSFGDEIEVIECDATKVNIDGVENVDILVSENLSTGLFDEPQYQIIQHLMPYLAPEAKIVPLSCTLYASFGWASWEGTGQEDFTIAAEKLHDRVRMSDKRPYMEIVSKRDMRMPHVSGIVEIPLLDKSHPVNTLFISTRFQMSDGYNPVVLNPDDAEFLGKTCAFRLPREMPVKGNAINFQADYPVGHPKKLSVVRIEGNSVVLESPLPR